MPNQKCSHCKASKYHVIVRFNRGYRLCNNCISLAYQVIIAKFVSDKPALKVEK